jgi:hypothetical protein
VHHVARIAAAIDDEVDGLIESRHDAPADARRDSNRIDPRDETGRTEIRLSVLAFR